MLHIVTGPMFSGKTSYLSAHLPPKSLYINHCLDTRGELFYSHNTSLTFLEDITCIKTEKLSDDLVKGFDIIGIDEAQFFKELKPTILRWVEKMGKTVYVAGLNCDYKRNKFGEISELFAYCDSVTKLTAHCICGKDAMFSHRLNKSNDQIVVGSSEYEPLCRKCFTDRNHS